jgi:S-DNA-T family DNA segregation ATPase FtsK/SpoIIIE
MLFYPSGYQKPVRVQGALVDDSEVAKVVDFIKENQTIEVNDEKVSNIIEKKIENGSTSSEKDEYFEAAARFIMEKDKATIGMLQRMFKIGFNRAARIMDQLADAGIVGPEEGTKPRQILMSPEELDQYLEEYI